MSNIYKVSTHSPEIWGLETIYNEKNLNYNMRGQFWTKKEIEYLLKNYKQKKTNWAELFKYVNHTKEAVINKAGYLGLTNKQFNWSENEINKLKNEYQNKKVIQFAEELNRTAPAIRRILSINKIKKKIKWHKYTINKDFFKNWTKESAYILGLISADGCINDREKHYSIEISSNDTSLLENVRTLMELTKPIEKERNNFRIRIDNREIYEDILNLGLTPRKSLTIQFPKVPEEFINHYIRGFFDGDGSIFRLKDGRVVAKFSCWSPQFLQILQKILREKCNVREKKSHDNSIVYYPIESFKVLNYLYKDSNIKTRLDRKYNRYIEYGVGQKFAA